MTLYSKKFMFFYSIATLLVSVFFSSGCHQWQQESQVAVPLTFDFQLLEKHSIWSKFIGYNTNTHDTQLSAITFDKSYIIVKQPHRVQLFHTMDGQKKWEISTKYGMTCPPATDEHRVFVATAEYKLLALRQDNGQILWSIPLPNQVNAQPGVDNQQVIVKTITGDVLAFNANNGKRLWHYQHLNTGRFTLKKSSAPKIYQNKVFLGFPDGKLVVLDNHTGQKIWEYIPIVSKKISDYSELVDVSADPIFENDTIYFNTYQGKIQALSIASGEIQWEQSIGNAHELALGKYLYTISRENDVFALDKTTGKVVWRQDSLSDFSLVGPTLDNMQNYVIVGDDHGQLYFLSSQTGQLLGKASFNISSPLLEPLISTENTVYAITRRGQLAGWAHDTIAQCISKSSKTDTTMVQDFA